MTSASDIMTKGVIVLNEEDEIKKASDIFLKNKINAIPIINSDNKLSGIVSETDLVYQESNLHIPTVFTIFDSIFYLESSKHFKEDVDKITATKIKDIMNKDVFYVKGDEDIYSLATVMADKKFYSIPVVNDSMEIIGVVSRYDIIKAMSQEKTRK
ncbi:MAG: CBS domain-containing protein [bacterium]